MYARLGQCRYRPTIIVACRVSEKISHGMACNVTCWFDTVGFLHRQISSTRTSSRTHLDARMHVMSGKRKVREENEQAHAVVQQQEQQQDADEVGKTKVLVLTGPTAVGKTVASIQIAKMLGGEIISADSVQVYRGLDIGSAKITNEEMDGIIHHCIDILDPQEEFSAGVFHRIATETIQDIVNRGKTPIVVGGTGFYLKWLVSGRPSTPASTKESEKKVHKTLEECFENKATTLGKVSVDMLTAGERWEAGVELVRSLGDAETADRLMYQEMNNWYRMNRVVDILLQAPGKTLAELDAESGVVSPYDFRCIYLTRDRVEMYRRIDERVEIMLVDGLVRETVEKLSSVEPDSNCATRAIGYRQTLQFIHRMREEKKLNDAFECTGDDIIQLAKDIQSASRKLCHRQMHWFRKEDSFHWISATGDPVGDVIHIWNSTGSGDEHTVVKSSRLTKEEEKALKTYQTVMTRLRPKSQELDHVSAVKTGMRVCGEQASSGCRMHGSFPIRFHFTTYRSTATQPLYAQSQRMEEVLPTMPARNKDVTDGAWDDADRQAVDQALKDADKIARLGVKTGVAHTRVLLGQKIEDLEKLCTMTGQPTYRAKQMCDAVYRKGVKHIDDISNIPKAWKELLVQEHGVSVGRSTIHHRVVAADGTQKFLLRLHDGLVVETVGIPADGSHRLTVCVSSQIGCPMRCTFCATGKGGFARNLMPHEIVDQVLTVQEEFGQRVSNVVFMGMGEPLLNIPSVMRAHEIINKELNIGARHLTISTVGVPNAILKLARYATQSTLAVSIHAPNQKIRETIVPSAKAYPLPALMKDCSEYFRLTGRRVTFEYTLLTGVNDDAQQAQDLATLLKKYGNMKSHVNVIPWNPVDESEFKRPSRKNVTTFVRVLEQAGIKTSIRVTRGLEAAAACGQLRNKHQTMPVQMDD